MWVEQAVGGGAGSVKKDRAEERLRCGCVQLGKKAKVVHERWRASSSTENDVLNEESFLR